MELRRAYLNAVAGVVPEHDVHRLFIDSAEDQIEDPRLRKLFLRMAERSGIEHRWSVLRAGSGRAAARPSRRLLPRRHAGDLDSDAALCRGGARLALRAIGRLASRSARRNHPPRRRELHRLRRAGDRPDHRPPARPRRVERTLVGFMGCYAAVCALRTAYHIARSSRARGCSRSPSSSARSTSSRRKRSSNCSPCSSSATAPRRPGHVRAGRVRAEPPVLDGARGSAELIQWQIGDTGFEMTFSGEVPARIQHALEKDEVRDTLFNGWGADEIDSWAVHAGGRSILDAAERGLELPRALCSPRATSSPATATCPPRP